MTKPPVDKWNDKYATAELSTPAEPAWVLKQHTHLLPLCGRALDLACGLGGNARFLARCGLQTQAWDISSTALQLLAKWSRAQNCVIETNQVDLTRSALQCAQFDVIVVSRFLDRTLLPGLVTALKPNGRVFYQTFLAPVQQHAPQNPEFYLRSGEYQQYWTNDLSCDVYGEGWLSETADHPKQRYAWYIGQKVCN